VRTGPRLWRHPYRGTSRHAQSAYPFVADPGLGPDGVLIGHDALGRAFCYDPFVLYQQGRLNGPNLLLLGDIGYGKSALTKAYLYRQAVFGYVPLVTDVKGEYDRLCEALEVNPVRFTSGGHLRLNPLDPKVGGPERPTLLRSVAELLLGRNMQPREGAALEQAWTEVELAARRRHRQPCLPELVTALLRPTQDAAGALETRAGELVEWGRDVAFSLRRLVTGDLGGMFDQETSLGLDLDARMVSVNLRQVSDDAKPILVACVAAWLKGVWANGDGLRRIVVQEEAWHLLRSPAFAELQQQNFKLARQYGVQNVVVAHHLGDLHAAGDAGSRTAELARGLLADAATRVLYHLDEGELHATAPLLGLNRAHTQVIPKLPRGAGLWLVGGRAHLVHHHLAPPPSPESWIVDTDQAMRAPGGAGPPA
jgi:type IV secretory pathway VirB4 component